MCRTLLLVLCVLAAILFAGILRGRLAQARADLVLASDRADRAEHLLASSATDARATTLRLTRCLDDLADAERRELAQSEGLSRMTTMWFAERDLRPIAIAAARARDAGSDDSPDPAALAELQDAANHLLADQVMRVTRERVWVQAAELVLCRHPSHQAYARYDWGITFLADQFDQSARMARELASLRPSPSSIQSPRDLAVTSILIRAAAMQSVLADSQPDVALAAAAHKTARFLVQADADWQPCGLTVDPADTIIITSQGTWEWYSGLDWKTHDQRGLSGASGGIGLLEDRLLPAAPNGALLFQIRTPSDAALPMPRPVANSFCHPANASGPLEFRINSQSLSKARGRLELSIWIIRPLPSN